MIMRLVGMLASLAIATLCYPSTLPLLVSADEGPIIIDENHPILNDPESLQAMEIFMAMSPQEREETILNLLEAVGDDPVKRAEMELIIAKLPALEEEQLERSELASTLKQMVSDDEVRKARATARKHLDGTSWEFFVENQAAILETTVASGKLSPAEVKLFKNDKEVWMSQLRVIWEDITKKQEL